MTFNEAERTAHTLRTHNAWGDGYNLYMRHAQHRMPDPEVRHCPYYSTYNERDQWVKGLSQAKQDYIAGHRRLWTLNDWVTFLPNS